MPARIDRALVRSALQGATTTRHLTVTPGAVDDAGALFIAAFGDRPAIVIADETTFAIAGERVQRSLRAAAISMTRPLILPVTVSPDYADVTAIRQTIAAAPPETIPIAVGAGTINDLVKRAAFEHGLPYMAVATAASMDGYTASGASLLVDGIRQTVDCPAPVAVVGDTEILAAAPGAMTAAGYGDLVGKITAGADWLLADALGIEPIVLQVWSMVQDPLRATVAHPERLHETGNEAAIEQLFLGLAVAGLAIQATGSSRPASGSEHQLAHFDEMMHPLSTLPHGFRVALGTLAATQLYEQLLAMPLDHLDPERASAHWPSLAEQEDEVRRTQPTPRMVDRALEEVRAKYASPAEVTRRLQAIRAAWPALSQNLEAQLIPSDELRILLATAGCPTIPEGSSLTDRDLRASYIGARQIRRRYTVLDLAFETGVLTTHESTSTRR